ncbi:MAG TPA: cyclic lactone autoinducer peptide [Lachnospiraceae bacterium]|nr:cyclic lactone autoinducer peptide [Lachnospiraceae bacterium]
MKKTKETLVFAKALERVANTMIVASANSRCAFVYHQPKSPTELKKFRKF